MADDERAPKPGHFLPGGAGDQPESAPTDTPGTRPSTPGDPVELTGGAADPARTALTSPDNGNRKQSELGAGRPISPPANGVPKKAAPLPSDPEYQGFYSGPPPAPLPNAPTTPLSGTRRLAGPQRIGWHTSPKRTGVRAFEAQPKGPQRFSRRILVLLCAVALIAVSGGTVAAYSSIGSPGSAVADPLNKPSEKPADAPSPIPPPATETVIVPAVPDDVRVQKNELYKVGKLPGYNCALPKVKPNTKTNVLRFYQAMLPCLAETWEPLVLKADYPFRQPKLALATKGATGACGGEALETSFYCPEDETIYMRWEDDVKFYKQTPVAVVDLVRTMAHEYSHHVQTLTNILISSDSQARRTTSKAVKLEWSRRLELQASCLGAAFVSANKKTLGLVGENLVFWNFLSRHIGDELTTKKVRDHGSSKSYLFWSDQGFKTANPASCNTYVAPSAKVS
ncbi:neutral zinc metallopeptidase [Streptomyces sp. SID13031]|uniref:neutral zinc metallopeptidase n=1 Tax=Streptomyces sp. SID13031 TaxID=2706046 RepID=UPI0013CBAAB2|nr:neutral zinc metallopeptidase [Streptomyces sp. SID13031]NEA31697.1 hypothetical protein [Streptomyces sp. SID13031]